MLHEESGEILKISYSGDKLEDGIIFFV